MWTPRSLPGVLPCHCQQIPWGSCLLGPCSEVTPSSWLQGWPRGAPLLQQAPQQPPKSGFDPTSRVVWPAQASSQHSHSQGPDTTKPAPHLLLGLGGSLAGRRFPASAYGGGQDHPTEKGGTGAQTAQGTGLSAPELLATKHPPGPSDHLKCRFPGPPQPLQNQHLEGGGF